MPAGIGRLIFFVIGGVALYAGDAPDPCLVGLAQPVYPPLAKQARVHGSLLVRFDVDALGKVANIAFDDGQPLWHQLLLPAIKEALDRSTLDAQQCGGRQFRFTFLFEIGPEGDGSTEVAFRAPETMSILTHPQRIETISCPGPDRIARSRWGFRKKFRQ